MSTWSVSHLDRENIDQYISIVGESLHYYDRDLWQTYIDRVGQSNFRLVNCKASCIGGLAFYRMGQWFGGRKVPSAGVSGVGIDPAQRGTGACKTLLEQTLCELHEEKMASAALYASTRSLYRSVGFEVSGHQIQYQLKMPSFRADSGARELEVSRHIEPDFSVLAKVAEKRGIATNGNIARTEGLWQRIIEPIGRTTTTYLLGEPENAEGFVTLLHGKREFGHPQPLVASDWVALTPRALQRVMLLAQDHRSMCDTFQWNGGPQDPLLMTAKEEHLTIANQLLTLNRIVHLESALESRGYPEQLDVELHFQITDRLLSGNSGSWILRVSGGKGEVEPGGSGAIRCDVRDLVPIYTSMHTASQMAAMGRLQCDDQPMLDLADLAFSGPAPWTVELF